MKSDQVSQFCHLDTYPFISVLRSSNRGFRDAEEEHGHQGSLPALQNRSGEQGLKRPLQAATGKVEFEGGLGLPRLSPCLICMFGF